MRNFKTELQKDMEYQKQLLAAYEKELAGLPEGCLSSYQVGKKTYYKYIVKKSGQRMQRHVKKTDSDLISALCRKAYLKKSTDIIQKNLQGQERLLKTYESYNMKHILQELKPIYADGLTMQNTEDLIRRKQDAAIMQAVHPERLTQPTLAGFYVRSKSETIIVNMMTGRRVRFVYEKPVALTIPGRGYVTMHPDFVIYLDNGEIIIWEHLGMLSNDAYAEAQIKKLQMYHQAGYTLGRNLFLTADNADGTLDVTVISRMIDEICERGGCY